MGATIVAPEAVAPAAAALLADGGGAAAIGAVGQVVSVAAANGPRGWLTLGASVAAGVVVVAGDDESLDFGCWQDAIGSDALASLSADKVAFHTKHGMLLSHVQKHCETLQAKDDGRLILKNKAGEHFGLTITHVLPVNESGPELDQDVTLVHAVRVQKV